MLPDTLKLMVQAVREQRRVAIRYHGQHHTRIVEPHAVYTHERGGLVADCYQVHGYSGSGRKLPYWRPFRLKKISSISLLDDRFGVRIREGFNAGRQRYRSGLLAMVEGVRPTHTWPIEVLQNMGPKLSERNRLY